MWITSCWTWVLLCARVWWVWSACLFSGAGAGVCGQSVYLRGGTTPSWSTAFSGLTLLFPPHPNAYSCVWRTSRAKGSVWLPPTLAAIISKRKKVAGAAATTRHATNSSNWTRWNSVCVRVCYKNPNGATDKLRRSNSSVLQSPSKQQVLRVREDKSGSR